MWRTLAVISLGCAIGLSASAQAQTPTDVGVIRPGDTIQWVASAGQHLLKFGGNGTTPLNEINDVLTFDPPLDANGQSTVSGSAPQKATVKDTAPLDKQMIFTCGIHQVQMVSVPFVVKAKVTGQPARTHRIFGQGGQHWHLHVDTTP